MLNRRFVPTPLYPERPRPAIAPTRRRAPMRVFGGLALLAWLFVRWFAAKLAPGKLPAIAVRIRRLVERHGGAWIKAAQLVAMRRDLFPAELCAELAALQDKAAGFSVRDVRRILAEELEASPSEVFAAFDPEPIAAGSVGQVHRGFLRDGTEVAVKIQRPGIAASFAADLKWIRRIVGWLERLGIRREARWSEFVWELEHMLANELDYRIEASAQTRMRPQLAEHGVYVPNVFMAWSSKRVLVMEFVAGVFMSEFIDAYHHDPDRLRAWLTENGIDARAVGQCLYDTHTRQVFEDNMFHGDLHPGNIALLKNNRIALIDFGSIGTIDNTKLKKYYLMFQAIADGKFEKAAELLMLLGPGLPVTDPEPVKSALVKELRLWEERSPISSLPYHERSMTTTVARMAMVLQRHRIPATWEFMRVNRAEVTMDASLAYLIPDIDYFAMIREYERQARMRELERSIERDELWRRLARGLEMFDSLEYVGERLYFDAEWARRRAASYVAGAGKLARATANLFGLATHAANLLLLAVPALFWYQHGGLHDACDTLGITDQVNRLPVVTPAALGVGLVVLLYLRLGAGRIRTILREPEIQRPA